MGLVFDMNTNWINGIYENGAASDGYYVFIDKLPCLTHDPTPIPAGMDAVITLAQPQKVSYLTDCYPNDHTPKLKYFDYYDPHNVHCTTEVALDVTHDILGCFLSALSYFPEENQTCTLAQYVAMGFAFSADTTFDESFTKNTEKMVILCILYPYSIYVCNVYVYINICICSTFICVTRQTSEVEQCNPIECARARFNYLIPNVCKLLLLRFSTNLSSRFIRRVSHYARNGNIRFSRLVTRQLYTAIKPKKHVS